jgi:hypothetical protein
LTIISAQAAAGAKTDKVTKTDVANSAKRDFFMVIASVFCVSRNDFREHFGCTGAQGSLAVLACAIGDFPAVM